MSSSLLLAAYSFRLALKNLLTNTEQYSYLTMVLTCLEMGLQIITYGITMKAILQQLELPTINGADH
jgi:hypothetical protein